MSVNSFNTRWTYTQLTRWIVKNSKMISEGFQVKLSVYSGRDEVANIVFNRTGSTMDDWFHPSRMLSSTWTHLLTEISHDYFSLAGYVIFVLIVFLVNYTFKRIRQLLNTCLLKTKLYLNVAGCKDLLSMLRLRHAMLCRITA